MVSLVKKVLKVLKRKKVDADDKRNFLVLIVACILNFSFAFEKLFIVIGHQQPDWLWLIVYGWLGLILAWVAVHDYCHDIIEEKQTDATKLI